MKPSVLPWLVWGIRAGVTRRATLTEQNSSISLTVLRCLSMEQPSTSFLSRPMLHMVTFERKSERWFCLLVWTLACNPPHEIMKHLSSSNSAAVWDTFCLPPPQSCSHLLQLFNTVCATVWHTHLPFCSPFSEISFFWQVWGWGAGNLSVGAKLLSCCLLFLECLWKILLLVFSLSRHSSFCLQTWWSNSNIAATKAATLVTSGKLKCSALKLNAGCSQTRCCTADPGYDRPTLRYTCFTHVNEPLIQVCSN